MSVKAEDPLLQQQLVKEDTSQQGKRRLGVSRLSLFS